MQKTRPWLADSWQNRSCCWYMIEVQVQHRILSICLEWYMDRSSTVYLPTSLAMIQSMWYWVVRSECDIRLANWWHSHSFHWQLIEVQVHRRVLCKYSYGQSITASLPMLVGNSDSVANIENNCQKMSHRFTYSWHSRSFCLPIIEVVVLQWILRITLGQIQHSLIANPDW